MTLWRDRSYRPIGDYAIIGDAHTAALVASDGSIDWLCWPRFDSAAVFCRLLDRHKGGWFRVGPAEQFSARRTYIRRTNVLVTEFRTDSGAFRVTDFMPVERLSRTHEGEDIAPSNRILRIVEGLSGRSEVEISLRPTFDYARREPRWFVSADGLIAEGDGEKLALSCPVRLRPDADGIYRGRISLAEGARLAISLSYLDGAATRDRLPSVNVDEELGQTLAYWREWAATDSYDGPYANLVRRSALALKLLTYEPTGAIIAAPTTSLPEAIGGERNWDYRFTWLRDSALILYSLQLLGYFEEATDFFRWLHGLCLPCTPELRILYTIDGEKESREEILDHLEGYRGSRPVRIGNGAASQKQLDIYGEVIDAIFLYHEKMHERLRPHLWDLVRHFADETAHRWHEPDQGIWEVRTEPRHFLYSKLLCWVALDRAIRMAKRHAMPGDIARWTRSRDAIRRAILTYGYSESAGAFTQAFGVNALDASALVIPRVGFLPATDPRIVSTVEKIQERLSDNGFVYRYLNDDGVSGHEAPFALCSFWLIDCLAGMGRVDEARDLFERVTQYGNDVCLFAEEIDPSSGELLGNFPQGFTHLGLIQSAVEIAKAEELGPERTAQTMADRSESLERAHRAPSAPLVLPTNEDAA